MKTLEILKKNFKLLFRSKETAFMIIFGPLLIILLVGFAFSGSQNNTVMLGVYAPSYTTLTDQFVQSLTKQSLNENYVVNILDSEEKCISSVKDGTINLCILFPSNFIISPNKTNSVSFVIDTSRINLAYSIIDELSKKFGIQTTDLSADLTNKILERLISTKIILKNQTTNSILIKNNFYKVSGLLKDTNNHFELPNEVNLSALNLKQIRGQAIGLSEDAKQLHDILTNQIDDAMDLLNSIKNSCGDDCSNRTLSNIDLAITDFNDAKISAEKIYDTTPDKLTFLNIQIDDASTALNNLKENYGKLSNDSLFVSNKINIAKNKLLSIDDLLFKLSSSLNYTFSSLDSLNNINSNVVANPIRTEIIPVSSQKNKLVFMYPYILMLIIMFMGLILGSALIISDKNSKAAFRNFTTSTRDSLQILLSFITTLIILLTQTIAIFFASYFLVSTPLFNNIGVSFIIILLAITLFSFLGMIVGYLSRNQESSMIISLTLGSIMLFISNLVIPIEGMNYIVKLFTFINPYVILSELLKKSMLFNIGLSGGGGYLLMIFIILIILFGTIIFVQKYFKKKYFQQKTVEAKPVKKTINPLVVNGREAFNEYDLLTMLDFMTRREFENLVSEKDNIFSEWCKNELKNIKLAKSLRTTSKERMIIRLDKYLKKITKKI